MIIHIGPYSFERIINHVHATGTGNWIHFESCAQKPKIKKIHITEDTLDVAITKVVTIVRSATPLTERCPTARETASDGVCLQTVSHVSADFDEFGFNYAKTTFPKMDDNGTATAQLVDLSATISFEIVVDDSGALTVDNVKANIKIGALDVQVRRR